MSDSFNPAENHQKTKELVGYVPRVNATEKIYSDLGFKCGLEIHQQLKTDNKLFCRCPVGLFQKGDDFDAEVIRHMRPTLSEMGEYDGTALMERRTKKNIIYRLKNESACTYDIDDTPPFPINKKALDIAVELALMLKTNVVGELHITRKQYLDGSIPTGFQRTAIVGIEGEIPLKNKKIGIIQLSIEEDSCREVSDVGHWRIYTTDRLGTPLIEMVTYPEMLNPDEAAEAGQYLRFLARSSGKVRTGIGAGRQDVNVSITGGTRIEIKGVQHISWIPELTHNEAFRQKALLEIKKKLSKSVTNQSTWKLSFKDIDPNSFDSDLSPLKEITQGQKRITAINLPGFKSILSFFTQPGQMFTNEISDRLKVIACLEKPNMYHSEMIDFPVAFESIAKELGSGKDDSQLIVWGPTADIDTALEVIEERCLMAFDGIPNETRKSLSDGTTLFERVLPGPDRMYPDTDSAPLSIDDDDIEKIKNNLPVEIIDRYQQFSDWQIPVDTYHYLLTNNLAPVIEKITNECDVSPRFIGTLLGHSLKHLEGQNSWTSGFGYNKIYGMIKFIQDKKLTWEIATELLPLVYEHPNVEFESALAMVNYVPKTKNEILEDLPVLQKKFNEIKISKEPEASATWIMGQLRKLAIGNIPLKELYQLVKGANKND
ncbi:MAG: Glu-tRNA(Gln) amidotransferase subunit GatE [candidate division Zixibacteria bacterium]|nr:Glu-tRNA(Gln) amidotransferase subunit GatE [candidate division Zixibacteria bacterium]